MLCFSKYPSFTLIEYDDNGTDKGFFLRIMLFIHDLVVVGLFASSKN